MRKLLFLGFLIPFFAFSQIPGGYYDGTTGLTGYTLKTKVYDIISRNYNWNYGDLPAYYNQTDLDHYYDHDISNTTIMLDIYSEIPGGPDAYEYTNSQMISGASAEGMGYNREHILPQSTFNSMYPMYSDLHTVIPADARINQLRSNYPHAVGGSTIYHTFTNTSGVRNDNTPGYAYTGRVYEPIDEFKGDVARMILYFAVRYESQLGSFNFAPGTSAANDTNPFNGTAEYSFDPGYLEMLKLWHVNDPVSVRETDRNNAVYNIQKNRNPFIDNPQWVNLIWSAVPDAVAPQSPQSLNITHTGAHFVNLSWTPSADTDVLGYRIYMNADTTPVAVTKGTSVSIDRLSPGTAYSFTVKSYDNGYLESVASTATSATTLATDAYAKDLMITKYIEGTGNNKAIEILNNTGHEVNLNNYQLSIQYSSGGNYYFSEGFQMEGTAAAGEVFVVRNPKATLSCMTNEQAKFVTASDPLTFTGTQYVELAYKGNLTVDAVGIKNMSNSLGNISLYRQFATQPNTIFTASEWQSYPSDYCQNLGVLGTSDLQLANEKDIVVYPNPAQEQLFTSGKAEKVKMAKIYDLTGKLIKTEHYPFKNKNSLDVGFLHPGVYILTLDEKSFKFIKK